MKHITDKHITQSHNETTQQTKEITNTLRPGLCVDNPLATIRLLRGVFLANHMASTDNLTSKNQKTEYIQIQTNVNTKVSLINNIHTKKPTLTERTDRAWLSPLLHLARKRSGSILTTLEPARAGKTKNINI